jgi:hypothetical protein
MENVLPNKILVFYLYSSIDLYYSGYDLIIRPLYVSNERGLGVQVIRRRYFYRMSQHRAAGVDSARHANSLQRKLGASSAVGTREADGPLAPGGGATPSGALLITRLYRRSIVRNSVRPKKLLTSKYKICRLRNLKQRVEKRRLSKRRSIKTRDSL